MRSVLALLFLAACSQQSPPVVERAGEISLAEMTYHCTEDGREFVRFEYDGVREDRLTERACDYEEWRADVDANGPIYSRPREGYREWLARNHPEA